jgi:Capsule polysaccharide biosynthesis protein
MRLLFIENRYATRLNEAVARELLSDGHEIGWIVQNPLFAPGTGQNFKLRFPGPADLQTPGDDALFARLRRADRGVLHFGLSGDHHPHYLRETERVFDAFKPDVVFGESTQMHELLAIEVARRRGLPYLFPTATRYPPSRMCFLAYDSMEPVGGCGQDMPADEAAALIEAVNLRSVTPSYMSASTTPQWRQRLRSLGDRLLISYGWWRGERFITPSPWRKLALDRAQRELQRRWDSIAQAGRTSARPCVLYPLQMQPESTIDVWGLPWNDQADIVRRAARALAPLGWDLVVKPNPKSKYEIDARVCAVAQEEANVVAVAHGVPMQALFGPAGAILSVTGTVLIEAVFAGKLAFSLGDHAMAHYPGVIALAAPEALVESLAAAPSPAAAAPALELLHSLHASSYLAEVVDPLNQSDSMTTQAIVRLTNAFRHVLGVACNEHTVDLHTRRAAV